MNPSITGKQSLTQKFVELGGVDPEVVLELLLSWNRVRCRPPLPDEEVIRTVDSITRLHRQHEPGAGDGR